MIFLFIFFFSHSFVKVESSQISYRRTEKRNKFFLSVAFQICIGLGCLLSKEYFYQFSIFLFVIKTDLYRFYKLIFYKNYRNNKKNIYFVSFSLVKLLFAILESQNIGQIYYYGIIGSFIAGLRIIIKKKRKLELKNVVKILDEMIFPLSLVYKNNNLLYVNAIIDLFKLPNYYKEWNAKIS